MGIKPVKNRAVTKTTTSKNEFYKLTSPQERYKLKLKIEQNKKKSSTLRQPAQQRLTTTTTTKRVITPVTPRPNPRIPKY